MCEREIVNAIVKLFPSFFCVSVLFLYVFLCVFSHKILSELKKQFILFPFFCQKLLLQISKQIHVFLSVSNLLDLLCDLFVVNLLQLDVECLWLTWRGLIEAYSLSKSKVLSIWEKAWESLNCDTVIFVCLWNLSRIHLWIEWNAVLRVRIWHVYVSRSLCCLSLLDVFNK